MGRDKRNKYTIDLHQQAYNKLTSMQAFGQSKKEAVANGTDRDKIFSFSTYQTYWKHTKYFIKWVQANHPECTTLKAAKKHVNTWLQERVDQGLSAWTVQTEAKALGKLYGIQPDDPDYFQPPKRIRADIKRSRGDRVRDKHFSKTNNADLIKFCQGTGLRKAELSTLKGSDLVGRSVLQAEFDQLQSLPKRTGEQERYMGVLKDALAFKQDYFVHVRPGKGKGGRERFSPIIGPDTNEIVGRMREVGPDNLVFVKINSNADIHSYRSDYAARVYREYARPIDQIPFDRTNKGTGKKFQGDVYVCRKDEAKKKLDKAAMKMCSKALGHNRVEVVATNYSHKL